MKSALPPHPPAHGGEYSFENHIKQEIQHNGPMSVATFMGLAVGHYYNSRDPFGVEGDFTTAPEISQMFGEMIGAWAADCWRQMRSPKPFALAECGPGRGTLMADVLRVTGKVAGFHDSARIHLIEASETLKQRQKETLKEFDIAWHNGIDTLPSDMPLILLANEFLDALPVRQFQFLDGRWNERVIGLDGADMLHFGLVPAALDREGIEGDFYETSPARREFAEGVCGRLERQGGAALFIDYGYIQGGGDTLQAVKDHQYAAVLDRPGEADLTAHVDFGDLADMRGVAVHGPVTQGEFLNRLGIGLRAAMLKQKAAPEQAEVIDAALARLTGAEQMGELFKVIAFSAGLKPAGFE